MARPEDRTVRRRAASRAHGTIAAMLDRTEAIRTDSARIADLVDPSVTKVDLEARVPGCPDWALRDLVLHIGEVQRFWAGNIKHARVDEPWPGEFSAPPSDPELAVWMRASTDALLTALDQTAHDGPCWTWWGDPATAGAVGRHQVQEAALHRWDAESAVGPPRPLDTEVATDGVAEFLSVMAGLDAAVEPDSILLQATDTDGRWTVGPPSAADGQPKATVRAQVSDLVLLLFGRIGPSAVEIEGDQSLVALLLEAIDTE
jgi:uncharacterized protein (TIGR03083 family)